MKTTHLIIAALLTSFTSISALAEITAAKPIYQPKPIYAVELRQARMEGTVDVSYTVDAKGKLTKLQIISSTDRAFEEPTREALRRWKFIPAMKDGVAVSSEAKLQVVYSGEWNTTKPGDEVLAAQLHQKKS